MSSPVTGLSKNKFTIKANSTQTINFLGSSPNYYYIVNGGNTPLYIGISMMPTENFYDAKIPSASSKLCVDAFGHEEIYVYNPSVEESNIIITSFKADFEPETLAMAGLGQDMSTIELSGEFDARGDLKTMLSTLKNNSDDSKTLLDSIKQTVSTLQGIINTTNSEVDDVRKYVNEIKTGFNNKKQFAVYSQEITVSASSLFTSYCEDNRVVCSIDFLSNDGEHDIELGICNILDNVEEYWTTITIKSGEVINNLTAYASAIKITCDDATGSNVRILFREGVK